MLSKARPHAAWLKLVEFVSIFFDYKCSCKLWIASRYSWPAPSFFFSFFAIVSRNGFSIQMSAERASNHRSGAAGHFCSPSIGRLINSLISYFNEAGVWKKERRPFPKHARPWVRVNAAGGQESVCTWAVGMISTVMDSLSLCININSN